jgi:hypothetical protein
MTFGKEHISKPQDDNNADRVSDEAHLAYLQVTS